MKTLIKNILFYCVVSTAVLSCQPKIDAPSPTSGSANFSTYVALGDGTPGGYADGALHLDAQLAAFPNLLSRQFSLVGGGEFNQPLVEAGIGYGFEAGEAAAKLALRPETFCSNVDSVDEITELTSVEMGERTLLDIAAFSVIVPGPYNNVAANGTRAIYANRPASEWTGTSGTFWGKIAAGNPLSTGTMLGDALQRQPTFFTINLGSTDIMRFAKSGGNQEVPLDADNDDGITPVAEFEDSLRSIVSALTATGAKGAIANLLDLESYPYITHYPYDNLVLTEAEATELNDKHTALGDNFFFRAGRNAYIMEDVYGETGKNYRRMEPNEYVMIQIPQDSIKCYKWGGLGDPLPKRWVLDKYERDSIVRNIIAYNNVIQSVANDYGLALVNSNEAMKETLAGTNYHGRDISTEYVKGNFFSLDGLNLSPLGQALLANNFIKAINEKFNATIPLVEVSRIPGIRYDE